MNKATLKIKNFTDRKNGWEMPIVEIESDADIKVINRGWNEFEAVNEIDEAALLPLREKYKEQNHVHLEIKTPNGSTCCWYNTGTKEKRKTFLNW